ncbi:phage exclusion protein Lit family protein [Mucilaginibacter sabulilitoris]|uniref:Phage exclusion protein Lit family protein n=1 Tax=Mucilaginibacter sabulilitoris TaxID=1173583 RepID=A0ABZ0TSZ2_9SPHI|nr:phage exclusion protein Lit family protein [Mucilaginibacter sabulilitoris]WPU96221.1 phage exclusion protein Lit family protein [Mucilaginibacter sabulilitoris]
MSEETTLPIRCLYDEITNFFEAKELAGKLNQAIMSNQLSRGIFIDPYPAKLEAPFADFDDRGIKLQATYLAYLWCLCYVMIAFQQMTIDQAEEEIISLSRSPECLQLNEMFEWAISLAESYSDWPQHFPNPEQRGQRIVQANALFLFAVRYLMYHEVGHLLLHSNSAAFLYEKYRLKQFSKDDSRRLTNMEIQADDYAIDLLLGISATEEARYMNMIGAAVVQVAGLFTLKDDDIRGGYTHPDIDVRLKRLAKRAVFDQQVHELFFDVTISIGWQVFFHRFRVPFLPADKAAWRLTDFSDLFKLIDQKVCERKSHYHQSEPLLFFRK